MSRFSVSRQNARKERKMDIEIQRGTQVQKDKPQSVHILLIGDDNNPKAAIHIYPKFEKDSDKFRVEIASGNVSIKPPLLVEFDI